MSRKPAPDFTAEERALIECAERLVHITMQPDVSVETHRKVMEEVNVINITVFGARYRRILEHYYPRRKKFFRLF